MPALLSFFFVFYYRDSFAAYQIQTKTSSFFLFLGFKIDLAATMKSIENDIASLSVLEVEISEAYSKFQENKENTPSKRHISGTLKIQNKSSLQNRKPLASLQPINSGSQNVLSGSLKWRRPSEIRSESQLFNSVYKSRASVIQTFPKDPVLKKGNLIDGSEVSVKAND